MEEFQVLFFLVQPKQLRLLSNLPVNLLIKGPGRRPLQPQHQVDRDPLIMDEFHRERFFLIFHLRLVHLLLNQMHWTT
jgi:hypothetical protein